MYRETEYHYYRKDSSYVRDALFKAYGGKCFYCGISLEPRHMHVDHILPTNKSVINDKEVKRYIKELEDAGFIQDSIENYVPSCASCNIKKSNQIFNASNLRFFHEQARKHVDKILSGIEQARKDNEYFYEPVSPSIWEELTFSYQRDISHAIMGYRLSSEDVNSCPVFPQVHKTEKLLTVVDHVIIQGETGCGKSISMFQVAHRFFTKGWKVYLLKQGFNNNTLILPDNTENSLYLVDDAQIFADT